MKDFNEIAFAVGMALSGVAAVAMCGVIVIIGYELARRLF